MRLFSWDKTQLMEEKIYKDYIERVIFYENDPIISLSPTLNKLEKIKWNLSRLSKDKLELLVAHCDANENKLKNRWLLNALISFVVAFL